MINNKRVLALITAREGSKGLPGKNIMMVNGKPLIVWSITIAKKSKYIDRLIISTDSKKIANIAKEWGCDVPFIRPDELATDKATSMDVIIHAINFLNDTDDKYDYLILLEPTSPLRDVEDIDIALEKLYNNKTAVSIASVGKHESTHPRFTSKIDKNGFLTPLFPEIIDSRRQDLDEEYFLDGTIYISDINELKKRKTFYHEKTIPHVVDRYKVFEVDELMDIYIIEAMMKYREKIKR